MHILARRWLAALICLAGLGLLALAAAAPLHRYFDIFSHLTWHAGGLTLGGCLALLWPRRALAALFAIALATLATPPLMAVSSQLSAPSSPGSDEASGIKAGQGGAMGAHAAKSRHPAAGSSLRVLSFNTWHRNRTPQLIRKLVAHESPDVIVFIEFGPDKRALADALAHDFPYTVGCMEKVHCAVQIFSRIAPDSSGTQDRYNTYSPPRAWMRIPYDGRIVTVHGVHVMRPTSSPRRHRHEMRYLGELLANRATPALIAGDFNATHWAASFRRFQKVSGLRHMGRVLPSWPAPPRGVPQLPIDHIFASRELAVERVWLGPSSGSDHLPLLARIGWR